MILKWNMTCKCSFLSGFTRFSLGTWFRSAEIDANRWELISCFNESKIALELLMEGVWRLFELLLFVAVCCDWPAVLIMWFAWLWSFSTVIGWHWEAEICCDWSSHTGATSPLNPPNGWYRCFWFDFVFRIPVRMNLWTWTVHIGV